MNSRKIKFNSHFLGGSQFLVLYFVQNWVNDFLDGLNGVGGVGGGCCDFDGLGGYIGAVAVGVVDIFVCNVFVVVFFAST